MSCWEGFIPSKKDYDSARKNFELALTKNPDSQGAILGLAQLDHATGAIDEAIAGYEKYREKAAGDLRIAMVLAQLYEEKGEPAKAKVIYEEILDKKPDDPVAANNLAFYYAEHEPTEENLDKADNLINNLETKHKESPQVLDTVAWIQYRRGNYEKAKETLSGFEDEDKRYSGNQLPLRNGLLQTGRDGKSQGIS